ncbi:Phosphotransferase enzyme family protein [Paenibacillus sp. cl141a]|uniref:phosphotransferase n=1 Tax=Paenibacillus sp. cl141a TaxID=1761877 RepID=UPI0008BC92D3|nr:phosphotransferase [Paenibacillus sp. cl141a]SEL67323.1 Phosphotransferase enzyme family protein [Paenibacillus sp. cl141a]
MPTIQEAALVLNQYYGIKKPKIEWIQNEPDKAVWKVIDNKETYILKSDYRSSKSFTPSITLQYALSQQGLKVPEVIATKQRKLCTKQGEHRYYLSKYISGGPASIIDRVRIIGDYHQHATWPSSLTSNQQPSALKNGINRWISEYQLKLKELMKWKDQYSLPYIQPCIQLAEKCIRVSSRRAPLLADHLTSVNNRRWLVHGDLTHLNVIKTPSGDLWIIDLEHSRIDSPIKDIRYLLPRVVLSSYYKEYFTRFPEGTSFKELYYIDAIFPHSLHFYLGGSIRQMKLPLKSSQVQEIVSDELAKDDMISKELGGIK